MSGYIEDRLNLLKTLPTIEPPPSAEAATLVAMAAAVPSRAPQRSSIPGWAKAAGLIVVLGAGALIAAGIVDWQEREPPAALVTADETELQQLLANSASLEQLLAALPQRRLMRVSTAGTIVGLEDRLALIDGALRRAEAQNVPPEYRAALLHDRIDVMNALVTVRYAQSPVFSF